MRAIRGPALVLLALCLSTPAWAASRSRHRDEAVRAQRQQEVYRREQERANRLALVLIQEEQARRLRQERPGGRAAPEGNAGPAADAGLDAVFRPDPFAAPGRAPAPSRDYPAAVFLSRPVPTATAGLQVPQAPTPAPVPSDVGGVEMPRAAETPGPAGIDLFHAGYSHYSQGDTERARAAFTRFMALNPGHDLADNAQYWIGESWAAEGRLAEALAAYRSVLDHFPFGDRVADALLKSGYVLLDMGRSDEARSVLRQVIQEFPGTGPASRAAERLAALPAE